MQSLNCAYLMNCAIIGANKVFFFLSENYVDFIWFPTHTHWTWDSSMLYIMLAVMLTKYSNYIFYKDCCSLLVLISGKTRHSKCSSFRKTKGYLSVSLSSWLLKQLAHVSLSLYFWKWFHVPFSRRFKKITLLFFLPWIILWSII